MDFFTDLTPKQARFCAEYLTDFNATKAALRAGYSNATALSGRLMTLPKIKQHLQQRGATVNEELGLSHKAILTELKKIAFASMGDYFDEEGRPKPMHRVDGDAQAALQNYTLTEDKRGNVTMKIRMGNKITALDKIAKHTGFYKQQAGINYISVSRDTTSEDDMLDDDSFNPDGTLKADTPPEKAKPANTDDDNDLVGDDVTMDDIRRWIQEARDQAIYETEKRMRAELGGGSSELQVSGSGLGVQSQAAAEKVTNTTDTKVKNTHISLPADKQEKPKTEAKQTSSVTFTEPIGYRLEQKRNKYRAVPKTHHGGMKL
jgi:phage terminase small subunit